MATGTDEMRAAADRVGTLFTRGRQAYASGQPEQAIELLREAAETVTPLIEQFPEDHTFPEALGTVRYDLGAAYLAVGRPAEAAEALSQALASFAALPGTHQPDPRVLMADTRARRAIAYALLGAGASAVVDAQAAIVAFVLRASPERMDSDYLGLSRVLMTGSDVLGAYADPEVALLAAQTGLTWCVQAAQAGAVQPDESLLSAMIRALSTERELLIALERADEAGNAEGTLQFLGTEPVATMVGRRLAGDSPGLLLPFTEAVAATGDDDLAALLLGEPVGPLCAPVFRVAPDRLTEAGLAAGEAALRLMDEDPDSAARLGLEAHFLLAAALEQQRPELTDRFDEVALSWCRALAAVATRCAADGDQELAADLGRWGSRVFLGIDPDFAERHAAEVGPAIQAFDAVRSWSEAHHVDGAAAVKPRDS
jgi:tetratricopeptide (TPR) repeat protein